MQGEGIPLIPAVAANAPAEIFLGDHLAAEVEWEVRAGYPDDAPPSLYTGAVMETSFKSGNPPQLLRSKQAATGSGATDVSLGTGCGGAYHARPRIGGVAALASPSLALRPTFSARCLTRRRQATAAPAFEQPARTGYGASVTLTAHGNSAINRFRRLGAPTESNKGEDRKHNCCTRLA
jgi:hypothetical protein